MVRESKYAESDKGYIHKLSIAQKELNETLYWLELLKKTEYLTNTTLYKSLYQDTEEVLKIITSIIIKKKKNIGLL